MSQVQMANMYGTAGENPWFTFTPAQLITASNAVQMTDADVAMTVIRSTVAIMAIGAALGALGGRLIGGKRRMTTGALLGAGVGAAYSSFQLMPFVGDTSQGDLSAIATRLGCMGLAAGGLGWGGWRLYKGR